MSLLTFIVLTVAVILANDFFGKERRADKTVKSKIVKNIPPVYWSYKTVDDIINGDGEHH